MNPSSDSLHAVTQEACRILGLYRRRLRAHEMMPEDENDLAGILEWVEELVMAPEKE